MWPILAVFSPDCTHSMKGTLVVWRFAIIPPVSSKPSAGFQHSSQGLIKQILPTNARVRTWSLFFSGSKARSRDLKASKQKERNVPLASADVRRGGRLRDEPKECLRRRLRRDPISPLCPSEESTRMDSSRPGYIFFCYVMVMYVQ